MRAFDSFGVTRRHTVDGHEAVAVDPTVWAYQRACNREGEAFSETYLLGTWRGMNKISEVITSGRIATCPKVLFETESASPAGRERLIVLEVRHRTDPSHVLRRS